MNYDEAREMMHKLNHGDAAAGVGKVDHVNLRDGITTDPDGNILSVREDTKIPIHPFNPLEEPDVHDVSVEVAEVGQETVDFWRNAQLREPKDDS